MSKRVHAARVKAAVREIILKQGKNTISTAIISQKLREDFSEDITADLEDLLAYGLGVAIGRVSSGPVQDPVVKDLFGDHSHEYLSLRGALGGKVHIEHLTPRLIFSQPKQTIKGVDKQKSQEEILYENAQEMKAKGLSEDMSIVDYMRTKFTPG